MLKFLKTPGDLNSQKLEIKNVSFNTKIDKAK